MHNRNIKSYSLFAPNLILFSFGRVCAARVCVCVCDAKASTTGAKENACGFQNRTKLTDAVSMSCNSCGFETVNRVLTATVNVNFLGFVFIRGTGSGTCFRREHVSLLKKRKNII